MDPPPSPPAGSPPPNSQGEHGDGARNTEGFDHLLEKLKNAGMEIDEDMARIIDEEIAGIKAEAMSLREATYKARRNKKDTRWRRLIVPATTTVFGLSLLTIAFASCFSGCILGMKMYDEYLKQELGVFYLNLARKR